MNVVRYRPYMEYIEVTHDEAWLFAEMTPNKRGGYVSYEDYLHLMGVIRNLRTKIEKKNRRSRKFKEGS